VHIRIATRKSALALWQAEEVSRLLREAHGDSLSIELIKMTTTGDQLLQESLATQGGKGLFVKELERGLLEKTADIAVHSMKKLLSVLLVHDALAKLCLPTHTWKLSCYVAT